MASTARAVTCRLPARSLALSRNRTPSCTSPTPALQGRSFGQFVKPLPWLTKFVSVASKSPKQSTSSAVRAMAATAGEQLLEQDAIAEAMDRVREHQKTAAQLSAVEEARTLVDICQQGVLSVHSSRAEGYPMGSQVGFAADEDGSPILAISSLSPHTQDLEANPRCSLFLSRDLNSMNRSKVTLFGEAETVEDKDRQGVRDLYLKKHPNAFWVDFGDFRFVRIRPTAVRLTRNVATFAMGASSSQFEREEFAAAEPDSVAQFEKPIMEHMNADHGDALVATVEHFVGLPKLDGAQMLELDRLGMRVQVMQGGSSFALRVPFTRPAKDRGDVKTLLVEMTRESMKALGKTRGGASQSGEAKTEGQPSSA